MDSKKKLQFIRDTYEFYFNRSKPFRDTELTEQEKEAFDSIGKDLEVLDQLEEILSMNYLVRVYGYEMAKRLQTYLKSNDAVKRWLDGKD